MTNVLMYGDTESSTDLFNAVPAGVGDPFLFVEIDGVARALVSSLDAGKVRAAGVEVVDPDPYGGRQLVKDGWGRLAADLEVARRALNELGPRAYVIPWDFPTALVDVLRADGFELTVDNDAISARRRVKSEIQVAGIRRAQAAANAAMAVARDLIHAAGEGLTCEQVRAAMQAKAAELGCQLPDDVIVGPNAQGAEGHTSGSGPIVAGDVVIVDIWPRDPASHCWADMTRTFMAGAAEPPADIAEWWELCRRALREVTEATRPGVNGRELHDLTSQIFEDAGQPTARIATGKLVEGFFHSLGHGVGLDLHERPNLGLSGDDLLPGDVIAIEPGCYREGYGGVRLEDLLLVTHDGCQVLTEFAYDL